MTSFDRTQRRVSWVCLLLMVGMLLFPPWVFPHEPEWRSAGHGWLWAPPTSADGERAAVDWSRLQVRCLVVAVGLVLLLFLHERRPVRGRGLPVETWLEAF